MRSKNKTIRWILLPIIIIFSILFAITFFFGNPPTTRTTKHIVTGTNASITFIMISIFPVLMFSFIILLKKAGSPTKVKHGVLATARILSLEKTGLYIHYHPVIRIELEVQPAHNLPYRTHTKTTVSERTIDTLHPGATIQVRYEAQRPERIEIVQLESNNASLPRNNTDRNRATAALEQLVALRDKGLITNEEFQQKRASILKSI